MKRLPVTVEVSPVHFSDPSPLSHSDFFDGTGIRGMLDLDFPQCIRFRLEVRRGDVGVPDYHGALDFVVDISDAIKLFNLPSDCWFESVQFDTASRRKPLGDLS